MATTKYKIAEQVILNLKGGNIKAAASVEVDEVMEYAGQVLNTLFKQEHLSVNMALGETIPEGVMLATYENVPVEKYGNVTRATLPATPISLPRNMGIFHVARQTDINEEFDCGFIPIQSGQMQLIKGERLISDLLGQVGYTPKGMTLIFTKDLLAEDPATTLTMDLAVMDINLYDDYDVLPIPADMEVKVIQECFNFFAAQQPGTNIVDPSAERTVK